jgi:uncharacterized membrane protein YczE
MTVLLHRLANLYVGLVLFGLSIAMMVRSQLGLASWDVLHQGLAERTGLRFGLVGALAAAATASRHRHAEQRGAGWSGR